MDFRSIISKFSEFFRKRFFNADWRCLNCGDEVFGKEKFCKNCLDKLPYNDGYICAHCGRKVIAPERYCSTCKGKLVSLDLCRSFFVYDKPISTLIQRFKYGNHRYLSEYFVSCLSKIYAKNYLNADFFVYVPMTEKAQKKRGYNQSKLLAEELSKITEVPVQHCLVKVKETKRQATLNRSDRLKNLKDAFRITNRSIVKDKTIVIIDDVTTTGATAQTIAEKLKKAGAKFVYLLTVASTPPYDKY